MTLFEKLPRWGKTLVLTSAIVLAIVLVGGLAKSAQEEQVWHEETKVFLCPTRDANHSPLTSEVRLSKLDIAACGETSLELYGNPGVYVTWQRIANETSVGSRVDWIGRSSPANRALFKSELPPNVITVPGQYLLAVSIGRLQVASYEFEVRP